MFLQIEPLTSRLPLSLFIFSYFAFTKKYSATIFPDLFRHFFQLLFTTSCNYILKTSLSTQTSVKLSPSPTKYLKTITPRSRNGKICITHQWGGGEGGLGRCVIKISLSSHLNARAGRPTPGSLCSYTRGGGAALSRGR